MSKSTTTHAYPLLAGLFVTFSNSRITSQRLFYSLNQRISLVSCSWVWKFTIFDHTARCPLVHAYVSSTRSRNFLARSRETPTARTGRGKFAENVDTFEKVLSQSRSLRAIFRKFVAWFSLARANVSREWNTVPPRFFFLDSFNFRHDSICIFGKFSLSKTKPATHWS